jgi:hypothetical protein
MTPADIIREVREQVQDTRPSPRYSDDYLLRMVNQAVKRVAILRPDLFADIGVVTCVAGAIQTAPADSIRMIEVLTAGDGAVVKEVNRETQDLMFITWQSGASGFARDWMRHVRSPNRFFVSPPSPAGQPLTVEYARTPEDCATAADTIPFLSAVYKPCLVDCVVWLVESVDDEHVNSGRARMFMDSFLQALGFTAQNKAVTDVESSNLPPEQVT